MNVVFVAGNVVRGILSRHALYIWGAVVVLMLLRAAPAMFVEGDSATREARRAMAVLGAFETWAFLCTAAAIFLGAATIASDIASKALLVVLARPVPRWQVLVGKWVGVTAFALVSLVLGIGLGMIAARLAVIDVDLSALAFAVVQSASAILVFGACAVALSGASNASMAVALTVMLVFVPGLGALLEADPSPAGRAAGVMLRYATPDGVRPLYGSAARFSESAVARVRRPPPVDRRAEGWALADNLAHTLFYLGIGCVAFTRRDMKL